MLMYMQTRKLFVFLKTNFFPSKKTEHKFIYLSFAPNDFTGKYLYLATRFSRMGLVFVSTPRIAKPANFNTESHREYLMRNKRRDFIKEKRTSTTRTVFT